MVCGDGLAVNVSPSNVMKAVTYVHPNAAYWPFDWHMLSTDARDENCDDSPLLWYA